MKSEIIVVLVALALGSCVQAYFPYPYPYTPYPQCSREGIRRTVSRAQFLLQQLGNCLNEGATPEPTTTVESTETATIDDFLFSSIVVTSSPETLPPSTEGSKRSKSQKQQKSRSAHKSKDSKNKHQKKTHHGDSKAKNHDKV